MGGGHPQLVGPEFWMWQSKGSQYEKPSILRTPNGNIIKYDAVKKKKIKKDKHEIFHVPLLKFNYNFASSLTSLNLSTTLCETHKMKRQMVNFNCTQAEHVIRSTAHHGRIY